MLGLIVNMIGALFLAAALGILGLVVYGCVANAYRETVLAEAKGAQAPKHRRYGHFLWRLVYPLVVLVGVCLKVMAMLLGDNPKTEEETRWYNGALWHHNSSIGGWCSYTADDDDPGPRTF